MFRHGLNRSSTSINTRRPSTTRLSYTGPSPMLDPEVDPALKNWQETYDFSTDVPTDTAAEAAVVALMAQAHNSSLQSFPPDELENLRRMAWIDLGMTAGVDALQRAYGCSVQLERASSALARLYPLALDGRPVIPNGYKPRSN